MRFIVTVIVSLLLASCASTPRPAVETVAPPTTSAPPSPRGSLIGADANMLATRFGTPRLRVREGDGTKLQFGGATCLLDVYLYPSPGGGGVPRVTHIDTRNRDGRSVDQASCIAMIERR